MESSNQHFENKHGSSLDTQNDNQNLSSTFNRGGRAVLQNLLSKSRTSHVQENSIDLDELLESVSEKLSKKKHSIDDTMKEARQKSKKRKRDDTSLDKHKQEVDQNLNLEHGNQPIPTANSTQNQQSKRRIPQFIDTRRNESSLDYTLREAYQPSNQEIILNQNSQQQNITLEQTQSRFQNSNLLFQEPQNILQRVAELNKGNDSFFIEEQKQKQQNEDLRESQFNQNQSKIKEFVGSNDFNSIGRHPINPFTNSRSKTFTPNAFSNDYQPPTAFAQTQMQNINPNQQRITSKPQRAIQQYHDRDLYSHSHLEKSFSQFSINKQKDECQEGVVQDSQIINDGGAATYSILQDPKSERQSRFPLSSYQPTFQKSPFFKPHLTPRRIDELCERSTRKKLNSKQLYQASFMNENQSLVDDEGEEEYEQDYEDQEQSQHSQLKQLQSASQQVSEIKHRLSRVMNPFRNSLDSQPQVLQPQRTINSIGHNDNAQDSSSNFSIGINAMNVPRRSKPIQVNSFIEQFGLGSSNNQSRASPNSNIKEDNQISKSRVSDIYESPNLLKPEINKAFKIFNRQSLENSSGKTIGPQNDDNKQEDCMEEKKKDQSRYSISQTCNKIRDSVMEDESQSATPNFQQNNQSQLGLENDSELKDRKKLVLDQYTKMEEMRKSIHALESNKFELLEKQREMERAKDLQKFQELNSIISEKDQEINSLHNKLQSMSLSMELLMRDLSKSEEVRKFMHDQMQKLKGNMRVFCRVKPIVNSRISQDFMMTNDGPNRPVFSFPARQINQMPTSIELNSSDGNMNNSSKMFHFDCVFPPESSQQSIFEQTKPFIQSAIDGKNVCIFAYGQTGSGKTYTMEGPDYQMLYDENFQITDVSGIIPRAAQFIFTQTAKIKSSFKREYSIEISSLEIYCDNLRDLYAESSDPQNGQTQAQPSSLNLVSVQGKICVQGQTWKKVDNIKDFLKMVQLSSNRRVFSNNGMNEHSSRSHHIFQIKIHGQTKSFEPIESLLNIIDLAGSERRDNLIAAQPAAANGSEGAFTLGVNKNSKVAQNQTMKPKGRAQATAAKKGNITPGGGFKPQSLMRGKNEINDSMRSNHMDAQATLEQESVSINQSLTTLGRVFTILADRKAKQRQAPPYRESKLTRLLQDCLTFENETLMIVNVCSSQENIQQTKESLKFASQAMLAY